MDLVSTEIINIEKDPFWAMWDTWMFTIAAFSSVIGVFLTIYIIWWPLKQEAILRKTQRYFMAAQSVNTLGNNFDKNIALRVLTQHEFGDQCAHIDLSQKTHGTVVEICNSDFRNANFRGADFSGATLYNLDFEDLHNQNLLRGAKFKNSTIVDCDFWGVDLKTCDFTGAIVEVNEEFFEDGVAENLNGNPLLIVRSGGIRNVIQNGRRISPAKERDTLKDVDKITDKLKPLEDDQPRGYVSKLWAYFVSWFKRS